jgi:hypothetical protein
MGYRFPPYTVRITLCYLAVFHSHWHIWVHRLAKSMLSIRLQAFLSRRGVLSLRMGPETGGEWLSWRLRLRGYWRSDDISSHTSWVGWNPFKFCIKIMNPWFTVPRMNGNILFYFTSLCHWDVFSLAILPMHGLMSSLVCQILRKTPNYAKNVAIVRDSYQIAETF